MTGLYSKNIPTEAGWYWMRTASGDESVKEIQRIGGRLVLVSLENIIFVDNLEGVLWHGPIPKAHLPEVAEDKSYRIRKTCNECEYRRIDSPCPNSGKYISFLDEACEFFK